MSESQKPPKPPRPEEEAATREAETVVLDPRTVEHLAMRGAASLLRQRPSREQAAAEPIGPAVTMENFGERMATAKRDRKSTDQTASMEAKLDKKREHLTQLINIASAIAAQMNRRAAEEEQKRRVATEQAKQEGLEPEEYGRNPYSPETTVVYNRNNYQETLKGKKLTTQHAETYATGWVLARKPIADDGRLMVQEILLGTDGRLSAYMREDLSDAKDFIGEEYSRQGIREFAMQTLASATGVAEVAPKRNRGGYYQLITSSDAYPILGIETSPDDHRQKGIEPELVQRGLEDLAVECDFVPAAGEAGSDSP